jgi:hypothetical protein
MMLTFHCIEFLEISLLAQTNPPPIRDIPQELATFLRQLWLRTGGANDNIADAQTESFTGLSTASIQALRQDLDYVQCQLSSTNQHLMAQRQEIDYLHAKIATLNGANAGLQQKLNNIEVQSWL